MSHAPTDTAATSPEIRHDWTAAEAGALFALPFNDLLHRAQSVHRANFDLDGHLPADAKQMIATYVSALRSCVY